MEVHSPVAAKRLWNVLRITFFMIRKGLISKRKMNMHMNLMMKKGKVLRKSLSNLMSSHHHHHQQHHSSHYEFSCSNSPNPIFFPMPKRKHHHRFNFPCIQAPDEEFEEEHHPHQLYLSPPLEVAENGGDGVPKDYVAMVPKTPEYSFNFRFDASEFAPGEKRSPLLSPFSVRVSNYSVRVSNFSALEENDEVGSGLVDDQAEDFIKRFYEQLKTQNPVHLTGF